MRRASILVLITLALCAATLIIYRTNGRNRDWQETARSLVRLEAGIEHEPKLLLRGKIADAAASLEWCVRSGRKRDKETRVQMARRAISHLEGALRYEETTTTTTLELTTVALDDFDRTDLVIECRRGKLYTSEAALAYARLRAARRLLAMVSKSDHMLFSSSINYAQEKAKCQQEWKADQEKRAAETAQQVEAKRLAEKQAAEKRARHRKEWPLHVDLNPLSYSHIIIAADGKKVFDDWTSHPLHLDAKGEMVVEVSNTSDIQIKVNGLPWEADWRQTPAGRHSARILVSEVK